MLVKRVLHFLDGGDEVPPERERRLVEHGVLLDFEVVVKSFLAQRTSVHGEWEDDTLAG